MKTGQKWSRRWDASDRSAKRYFVDYLEPQEDYMIKMQKYMHQLMYP